MHYEHDVNVMPPETDKARVPCAREPVLQSRQSTAQRAPGYRPDIDGLRALAVIAVVLFHDGVPGLDGGYVGVDVFFVISGYLITQLLEVARGESVRHTLVPFYLRRIRRILPALFATCLATAIAGAVLYVPDALVNLGKYLAAMPVLLSNVAAWTEGGGYFDPPTRQLALSHLWSIAVEEQFYLVYPLLLLTITRYLPAYRRATLIVLSAFSLALCIWASHYKPAANYYAAPTRAWELLLGAALALSGTPRIGHRIANECLALASLVGLVLVVHLYKQWTLYPGTAAILPCMATAVLITTGASLRPALINRVLSWQPLVFVGLISYSLYLWHQPLLVLVSYYHIEPYYEVERLGAAAMALELAALTLLAIAGSSGASAEEIMHGANSLFVSPTVKIAWAVQKGASENATTVVIRLVNAVGAYRQIRLDGVDPFTKQRTVLAAIQAFRGQIDLSVLRVRFGEFPSCEIHLYQDDTPRADQPANLTVYYLGVPDTTPEFSTPQAMDAYFARMLGTGK